MVLGEVIDSKDFCVMTLFLSGGNENNKIFTFLYSYYVGIWAVFSLAFLKYKHENGQLWGFWDEIWPTKLGFSVKNWVKLRWLLSDREL
jgi:hypothetical protein